MNCPSAIATYILAVLGAQPTAVEPLSIYIKGCRGIGTEGLRALLSLSPSLRKLSSPYSYGLMIFDKIYIAIFIMQLREKVEHYYIRNYDHKIYINALCAQMI